MSAIVTTRTLEVEPLEQSDDRLASVLIRGMGETQSQVDFSANVELDGSGAAWLPATLPLAMKFGAPLRLGGTQDKVAIANALSVQSLLDSWYDDLSTVEIRADAEQTRHAQDARGVGCFFSGGADSFYSAIERSEDITHLIFVTGFDIDIEDDALASQAVAGARSAARSLGKELIEVTTNIRKTSEGLLDWGTHYHGAALATVGLLLGNILERVIIPASYHVSDLFPWGSHPELDPLWNTSRVTFEHHGEDATRPAKVESIAGNDAAMNHLRICWENPGGAFNCGRCEKCIRTMVNLRVIGALDRCQTLPNEIDIKRLRSFRPQHGSAVFAKQNLEALKANGIHDKQLASALGWMVRTAPLWDAARTIRRIALRR